MGRPVIDALNKTNHYTLRVLTRNAQGEQAKNLTKTYPNVELVEDNYADEQAVRKLLTSVYDVFCNTDCWNCGGFQNEIDYGKMIFDISKELNVQHFVYSSLDHTMAKRSWFSTLNLMI
jgi:nucleoside-diphosphate-sugar epimerase